MLWEPHISLKNLKRQTSKRVHFIKSVLPPPNPERQYTVLCLCIVFPESKPQEMTTSSLTLISSYYNLCSCHWVFNLDMFLQIALYLSAVWTKWTQDSRLLSTLLTVMTLKVPVVAVYFTTCITRKHRRAMSYDQTCWCVTYTNLQCGIRSNKLHVWI